MFKILKNPDVEIYNKVSKAVRDNGGHCPCRLERTEDTKCICREFLEQQTDGFCHCGRYIKELVKE